MFTILLVIQVLVTIALVGLILIQRSDSDGLGGLGGGGGNAFMTGRGAANLLTKSTAILATVFMVLSLVLAIISSKNGNAARSSIVDQMETTVPPVPEADAPAASEPVKSEAPAEESKPQETVPADATSAPAPEKQAPADSVPTP